MGKQKALRTSHSSPSIGRHHDAQHRVAVAACGGLGCMHRPNLARSRSTSTILPCCDAADGGQGRLHTDVPEGTHLVELKGRGAPAIPHAAGARVAGKNTAHGSEECAQTQWGVSEGKYGGWGGGKETATGEENTTTQRMTAPRTSMNPEHGTCVGHCTPHCDEPTSGSAVPVLQGRTHAGRQHPPRPKSSQSCHSTRI